MNENIADLLRNELEEREVAEESRLLSGSLAEFVRAAWPVIKPQEPYQHNWHIEAICHHLEAVSRGEIDRLQVWIPPGMMKPVDVEALVLMWSGGRKRLGDVEVGDVVITHLGRPRAVTAVHNQGLIPVLKIETKSGRIVRAAPDHPFLTPLGWKEAQDLGPGDVLGVPAAPQTVSLGGHRSYEEMRLLGYFIGDGNCTYSQGRHALAANITCIDLVQEEDIVRCAESLGFQAKRSQHPSARRLNLSAGVRPWLEATGLAGHTSHTKRVPKFVFEAPTEHITHFLGAYFACDGTLTSRSEDRRDLQVVFNSVNRDLLEDVQHLLVRIGVRSRIRKHVAKKNNYVGGEHVSWRLVITSLDDAAKFVSRIPVVGQKAERLSAMGGYRTRFDEGLLPDPIVSVEPDGEAECRCLTVVEDHSFTANDLAVKNSMTVSVFWHPWEWTRVPALRYWGASYETRLAARLSAMSRDLILSDWYQRRWGHLFKIIRDAEHYWGNDMGGTRLATAPESTGQGEHGHRILIDDPINARAAEATSKVTLESTNAWYDGTVSSRGIPLELDGELRQHARVIIMQRLHDNDLAAHVLDLEGWEVLCLPERYEPDHPYVWPGDTRSEGDLLWPAYRTEEMSNALARALGSHRAAGQLQQRPAAREGQILKRHWWRFYNPKILIDPKRKPKFAAVVQTIDTPLKDKESSDNVAIQAWGVLGGDRYLIDLRKGKMNYSQARRAILEQARHVRKLFPRCAHYILIENAGYGVELIVDLKREISGVQKISPAAEGNKVMRAEAASSDLESGNCFLPGKRLGNDEFSLPDEANLSDDIRDFIESCALFPNAQHDDDVDAWSQCMNWLRSRAIRPARTASPFSLRRRVNETV